MPPAHPLSGYRVRARLHQKIKQFDLALQDYNRSVEGYNLTVKRFPKNILAGMFGFKEKAFYKADPGSEKAPDIKFDIK